MSLLAYLTVLYSGKNDITLILYLLFSYHHPCDNRGACLRRDSDNTFTATIKMEGLQNAYQAEFRIL